MTTRYPKFVYQRIIPVTGARTGDDEPLEMIVLAPAFQFRCCAPHELRVSLEQAAITRIDAELDAMASQGIRGRHKVDIFSKGSVTLSALTACHDDENMLEPDSRGAQQASLDSETVLDDKSVEMTVFCAMASGSRNRIKIRIPLRNLNLRRPSTRSHIPVVSRVLQETGIPDAQAEVYRRIAECLVSSRERTEAGLIYDMNSSCEKLDFEHAARILRSGQIRPASPLFSSDRTTRFLPPLVALFRTDSQNIKGAMHLLHAALDEGFHEGVESIGGCLIRELFSTALPVLCDHPAVRSEPSRLAEILKLAAYGAVKFPFSGDDHGHEIIGRLTEIQSHGYCPDVTLVKVMISNLSAPKYSARRPHARACIAWAIDQGALDRPRASSEQPVSLAIQYGLDEVVELLIESGEAFSSDDFHMASLAGMQPAVAAMQYRRLAERTGHAELCAESASSTHLPARARML